MLAANPNGILKDLIRKPVEKLPYISIRKDHEDMCYATLISDEELIKNEYNFNANYYKMNRAELESYYEETMHSGIPAEAEEILNKDGLIIFTKIGDKKEIFYRAENAPSKAQFLLKEYNKNKNIEINNYLKFHDKPPKHETAYVSLADAEHYFINGDHINIKHAIGHVKEIIEFEEHYFKDSKRQQIQ